MVRKPNTDRNGNSFSEQTIQSVWEKGKEIPAFSSKVWRWDKCGLIMKRYEYGNRQSDYGWEVDHINPVANGGHDVLSNLQPLNWKNNASKEDKLNWICP
jgi:5-methylcytosine-specific restriction endonuclease McrA